ncbi:concanavalin A-like lectin/glucanase [Auriculariales sp. MPI-PUGE-AT-0066]|nr:concanavalin A-like lectin/glucanase [Auriculariales sp. MPI-PUGE-AT-0066]
MASSGPRMVPNGSRQRQFSREGSEEQAGLLAGAGGTGWSTPPNRRFSHASSVYSFGDSKYPLSPNSADMHSTFVPTRGAHGELLSSRAAYDPNESNFGRDPDDALHEPDPPGYKARGGLSMRGFSNVLTLVVIIALIVGLFMVYPVTDFILSGGLRKLISNNVYVNGTGQAAVLATLPKLVDPETPDSAKAWTGYFGHEYELVFSDEFNQEGRTFFPGDDPFWEGMDIWYAGTRDLEWYDPENVYTTNGSMVIKLEQVNPGDNHELELKSAMVTTWNKFCFSSGYIEIRAQLPGIATAAGYWPGLWTLGNLGRAGYGATNDGMWPYSYDSCDVGVMPNQTDAGRTGPAAAITPLEAPWARPDFNNELSYLPGQRLSACTCKGQDHPGPWIDGENRYRGRSTPELDIIEAQKCKRRGADSHQCASQSAQFAPFNKDYQFNEAGVEINAPDKVERNPYHGSALQQSVSCITNVSDTSMRDGGFPGEHGDYGLFGFEYYADPTDPLKSYVTWIADGIRTHTVYGTAVGADVDTQVGPRLIPTEPMNIIFNLAVSNSFQTVDFTAMTFPNYFSIDYVRVYQRKGTGDQGVSCDPDGYPTTKYIQDHLEAYNNVNWTTWEAAGYQRPLNSLRDPGSC